MATVGTAKAERIAQTAVGRIVSCGALAIGILGLLRTGGAQETAELFVFTIHPLTAIVHTAIGLVGIAMVARPATTRPFLIGAGALLVLWGLGGIVLDDTPSSFFIRDSALVTLHLAAGVASLAAALAVPQVRAITMSEAEAAAEAASREQPASEPEPEAGRR